MKRWAPIKGARQPNLASKENSRAGLSHYFALPEALCACRTIALSELSTLDRPRFCLTSLGFYDMKDLLNSAHLVAG
jgi:hypothetical protein